MAVTFALPVAVDPRSTPRGAHRRWWMEASRLARTELVIEAAASSRLTADSPGAAGGHVLGMMLLRGEAQSWDSLRRICVFQAWDGPHHGLKRQPVPMTTNTGRSECSTALHYPDGLEVGQFEYERLLSYRRKLDFREACAAGFGVHAREMRAHLCCKFRMSQRLLLSPLEPHRLLHQRASVNEINAKLVCFACLCERSRDAIKAPRCNKP